jgi:hypothetical protein
MKKYLLFFLLLITAGATAQRSFRFGVSFGTIANSSEFVSGMEQANALFDHTDHGSGYIAFMFEKDLCDRFSLETGLSFTELGFTYSMAKDYSLRKPLDRRNILALGNCIGQVPLFLNYKTKLNCSNNRWFLGAGPQLMYSTENFDKTSSAEINEEGVTTTSDLSQHYTMNSFAAVSLAGQFGIEHVYKKGSRLRWTFLCNHGFSELGFSEVNYVVNGTSYTHNFSNSGSYAGFNVSWFFK